MKTLSLKLKISIVVSVGVLALVFGMGAILTHFAQQDLLATLSTQQLRLVSRVADDLDARLKLAMDSLTASAATMPVDVLADPRAFAAFEARQPALLQTFDQLLILDTSGKVTAAYPDDAAGVLGLDLHDRSYFQRAMLFALPVISDPLRGKVSGKPLVNFAAPIVDADGKVVSVMIGAMSLTKRDLLGLTTAKSGEAGYFAVVASYPDPVYLAHPDPSRVMQPVPRLRSSAMVRVLSAAVAGVTTGELEDGEAVLVAYRPSTMTSWTLAAILPEAEAFGALDRIRQRTTAIAIFAALIALPLVWLFAWRLLRPLGALREQVERIARAPRTSTLAVVGRDEVGRLAAAFNTLLLGQREAEVQRLASDQDRRRLVALLESSQDFVAMTDPAGHLTYLNAAGRLCRGLGINDDLRLTTLKDHVPPWAAERLQSVGVPSALRDGIWLGETAVVAADGREVPIDHTVIAHRNVSGELEFFSSLMHDTSAAKAASAAMRASEARMLSIADALPVLVSFLDCEHRYDFVNSRYEDHFGIDRSQIIGKSMADLLGEAAYQRYLPYLQRAATGEPQVFELESRAGLRPVHFLAKLIPQFDERRTLTGFHFIHQDVTDHKVEHQRLSQLIHADALTGLMNRAGFEVAIEAAMQRSREQRSTMALFYLDVDRFKSINDRHGHPVGDKLLRAFASRLVHAVRSADVAARLGGDEFVVIAEGLRSSEDVRSIAKKILRSMRNDFELGGTRLSISASIGIAAYSGEAMKADELVKRADTALYRAKNAGRDRYDLDDPSHALVLASIESVEAHELTSIF